MSYDGTVVSLMICLLVLVVLDCPLRILVNKLSEQSNMSVSCVTKNS